jgi:hypothetical protein
MAEEIALKVLPEESVAQTVGVFRGPWDTGRSARDGAVLGFEDVYRGGGR